MDDFKFFCGNGSANLHLGRDFFIHTGVILTVNRVDFINYRISYKPLRYYCSECARSNCR
jgi:hypothetical protein